MKLILLICASAQLASALDLYKDPNQPIPARVADLLSKMTVEEKIVQTYATHTSSTVVKQFQKTGVGAVKYMSAFQCKVSDMADCIKQRNELQASFMKSSRLKIPIAYINEGLHGGAPGGTVFPMPVNQGCSWNPELVHNISKVIATEAQALGVDFVFAPVVNMMTDPRFGRLQEGFSENPTITAHMAHASTTGLQGGISTSSDHYLYQNASSPVVVSLAKHFAGYGAATGGLNGGPADVTNRTLHEIYLKPWRALGAGKRILMYTVLMYTVLMYTVLMYTVLMSYGPGCSRRTCNHALSQHSARHPCTRE
jgi:beta-glucosidase